MTLTLAIIPPFLLVAIGLGLAYAIIGAKSESSKDGDNGSAGRDDRQPRSADSKAGRRDGDVNVHVYVDGKKRKSRVTKPATKDEANGSVDSDDETVRDVRADRSGDDLGREQRGSDSLDREVVDDSKESSEKSV